MPVLGAYKVRRDGREISQGNFKFHETHDLLFIKPFLISNTPQSPLQFHRGSYVYLTIERFLLDREYRESRRKA